MGLAPSGRCRIRIGGDHWLLLLIVLISLPQMDDGFYVPGVAPVEFKKGDAIDVKAIKLTSVRTQLPYEYYSMPFCRPTTEIIHKSENLGEILRGDRIVNTPYLVEMGINSECTALCGSADKPTVITKEDSDMLIRRIKEEYHVHLLIDNLPCATKVSFEDKQGVFYEYGYRLGFVGSDRKIYVNNHLDINLKYHEYSPGLMRVVGFEVFPRSINRNALSFGNGERPQCSPKTGDMLKQDGQTLTEGAENSLVWTYSVHWESSPITWASRWDIYLEMKDVQIHWFSIVNSLIVVVCLSGFLGVIIVRTVRRDIAKYNTEDELDETLEESGWKLVHGDVFRPPPYSKLLVSLIGTGVQLFGMTLITTFFAMLGMLSPASRGSLTSAAVFLFCVMGLISGYYAGRLYKTLRGVQWKRAALQTGFLFPAVIFGVCFILNFFLIGKRSSGAVPFTTMLALLFLWFGIDIPLVFAGFYFGFRKQSYVHPVRTNQIPRQVPEQPWYLRVIPCMFLAGVLPFGAMFIELFFIFTAIWDNQFYYMFGFLFLVFVILVISVGQIAIVTVYFLLCSENYHWWWKSFVISGGSAFYVFAYSIFYYHTKLEIVGFIPMILYFTYSFLMAVTFWLLTGTIGFYASYFFVRRIYGAVKID